MTLRTAAGERSLKTQNPCCADIAICFCRQGWHPSGFFTDGAGR